MLVFIAIIIFVIIILFYKEHKVVSIVANIAATVLLWKGLWDLSIYIDSKLNIDETPLLSGMLAIGSGLSISYIFGKTDIIGVLDLVNSHF